MKFKILKSVTKRQLEKIQNKKVCDVLEITLPSIVGPYKGWTGSVENEYFSIVFVKGIITVSVEERDICLGWEPINYSAVEALYDSLTPPGTEAKKLTLEFYNNKLYLDDLKSITFKDIMKSLKWKFKSNDVKVQEHYLNDETLTNS